MIYIFTNSPCWRESTPRRHYQSTHIKRPAAGVPSSTRILRRRRRPSKLTPTDDRRRHFLSSFSGTLITVRVRRRTAPDQHKIFLLTADRPLASHIHRRRHTAISIANRSSTSSSSIGTHWQHCADTRLLRCAVSEGRAACRLDLQLSRPCVANPTGQRVCYEFCGQQTTRVTARSSSLNNCISASRISCFYQFRSSVL